jgi:hypothetical protein
MFNGGSVMTDPLNKISPAQGPGKKNVSDTGLKHGKGHGHATESDDDSVDISEEARERSAGKKSRNILDYVNGNNE